MKHKSSHKVQLFDIWFLIVTAFTTIVMGYLLAIGIHGTIVHPTMHIALKILILSLCAAYIGTVGVFVVKALIAVIQTITHK